MSGLSRILFNKCTILENYLITSLTFQSLPFNDIFYQNKTKQIYHFFQSLSHFTMQKVHDQHNISTKRMNIWIFFLRTRVIYHTDIFPRQQNHPNLLHPYQSYR